MKKIVILGAGTAGTMMANHLKHELKHDEWDIIIIDERKEHHYQPGYLFLPFDIYAPEDIIKSITEFIPKGVHFINKRIEKIEPTTNTIALTDGDTITYDILIISTGAKIAPEETEGMKGTEWHQSVFDFYTFEGALALRNKLRDWKGGRLVVHITEMPIKCPVAPLEFAFLADSYLKHKNMRDKVQITFVTPLSGAFTKPKSTEALEHLLQEKHIDIVSDFAIQEVDNANKKIIDYSGKEVPFDLLVTVPTNKGDELMARSGLGDDLNYVPTNRTTLQSKNYVNIFVIGDASNIPASKAGSVAHFEAEILTENILRYMKGEPLKEEFDGHANCFIETGNGKALLIDFNYTHEPVEGSFPFPGVGPLRLLKESRMNHMGKLAFRWIYWNMLLKGTHIPFVSATMQEAGKYFD
ncbi:MAG: FAD-dependent oxidoreductase [Hydrotalea flava]|nr:MULTISPECIES: FAD/NAD(P)-binding oxidoreductase [Hydrotalea]MBY0347089.1 NAD(P)/FAD-dependent oxidoreductase [Hydrotalea flava]NIM36445.1 FAD-dependent oxidoreductase [Hydrotalea flava]NIM39303.1 FAD-dependent oxidoreductase [Hydrotalea flava]NIN04229.1 FAD-dependent oxidoreductase [Hydrotalea flava]NIN16164.1 FAD-dependent oxidoreductase [Hydrotalea flava]